MSIISAGTTTTTALVETGDTTGNLVLQVNGTTPSLTLNTAGAHGVGTSPSYGTSGQVLTSAGSAASPTWTTPSSGAMTLISTQTASSSASIAWTGLSGYKDYFIIIDNFIPASLNPLYIYLGTGAGPTYLTSGYLLVSSFINPGTSAFGGMNTFSGSPSAVMSLSGGSNIDPTYSFGFCGFGIIGNCNNSVSSIINIQGGGMQSSTYPVSFQSTGIQTSTTAKTAIKLAFGSVNITSGTASLYGISS